MVQRQKPFGTLASRTIGDIYGEIEEGGTTKGKNGLELQYDSLLRGQAGLSSVRRVGGGWTNVIEVDPVDGMDIRTTIDINIQDITEKSLVDKLKAIDAESGTAVVMEVETGEIKAITNMGRIREGVYGETKNHAVADEIEPGSTFKVASIMVALEDGLCNPGDTVDVGNGIYMYKGARMTDHNMNKGGYGRISVEQAIWYSSNIGVAKTILKGYSDNPTKFVEGLYRIGMNADLRLEIPGAGRAKIRRPDDTTRYWSKTTLPWMSFGYETQVPPINTLAFFNAIANNGKMVRPMFTKEILHNGKTVQSFSTEVINSSICSDHTLALIKDMLLGVVEKGTGKAVHSDIVRIAGKTGRCLPYERAPSLFLWLFPGRSSEVFLYRGDPPSSYRLSFGWYDVGRRGACDRREDIRQPYVVRCPGYGTGFDGRDGTSCERRRPEGGRGSIR